MMVRWTKSALGHNRRATAYRLDARLLRDDPDEGQGEPLASIEERFLTSRELGVRAFHQGIFWAHVDRKLDALDLEPGERDSLEEKIRERVPRPEKDWALYCVKCIPEIEGESRGRK